MPANFRLATQDPQNEVYLSVASVWESVVKHSLGKLPFPDPPAEFLPRERLAHRIASLPIDEAALVHLAALPLLHRDPFDRMLVAQSLHHGLTLLSTDPSIRAYSVPLLPMV